MTEQSGVLVSDLHDVSEMPLDVLTGIDDAEFTKCVGVVVRGSLVEVTQAISTTDTVPER